MIDYWCSRVKTIFGVFEFALVVFLVNFTCYEREITHIASVPRTLPNQLPGAATPYRLHYPPFHSLAG